MADKTAKQDSGVKVVELDHVVLRCRDLPGTLAFYVNVLDLHEERRIDRIELVQLRAGKSMLDLVPRDAADPGGQNVDHFCLGIEVQNMKCLADRLRSLEVEVIGEPAQRYGARGMGWSLYIRDPEGNVIELKQVPPASS
ncbi:MAG TPA: VOC family protein [Candidatus Binataceae bacterium]|jgi:glyoxylase I family protein